MNFLSSEGFPWSLALWRNLIGDGFGGVAITMVTGAVLHFQWNLRGLFKNQIKPLVFLGLVMCQTLLLNL